MRWERTRRGPVISSGGDSRNFWKDRDTPQDYRKVSRCTTLWTEPEGRSYHERNCREEPWETNGRRDRRRTSSIGYSTCDNSGFAASHSQITRPALDTHILNFQHHTTMKIVLEGFCSMSWFIRVTPCHPCYFRWYTVTLCENQVHLQRKEASHASNQIPNNRPVDPI